MEIPLELFQNIAQRLQKADLKRLRLTCKGFAENAIPFLFDTVFLSADPLDLESADLIFRHFKTSLKVVIVHLSHTQA